MPHAVLLILMLLVPGVILAALLIGAQGITVGKAAEACCARCRYPVVGLSGPICPECGGDLRGAGTIPAGGRLMRRPPRPLAAACRTILLVIPAGVALFVLADEYPRTLSTGTANATSASGLFRSLHIRGHGQRHVVKSHADVASVPRPRTRATLTGPHGRTVTLRTRDVAPRATYDGPGGRVQTPDGLDDADILAWMQAAGVDVSREEAITEAHGIATLIRSVVFGGASLNLPAPGGAYRGLTGIRMSTDRWSFISPIHAALVLVPTFALWLWLMRDLQRWYPRPAKPTTATDG